MTVKTLKQAIDNLPCTLNQLYDDAFCRIDDQNEEERDFAKKALRWVAYAYRPLTVRELEEALAIEPQGQDLDPDAIPDIAFVLEACAGLLIVDKGTEQVRLVHYTAQDYLDTLLTSRYLGAHASIAGDCITYLNYDVFQVRTSNDEPDEDLNEDSDAESGDGSEHGRLARARDGREMLTYDLLSYAVEYWEKHYHAAGQGVELGVQLYDFLASNPRIYLRDHWLYGRRGSEHGLLPAHLEKVSGILIAAYHGLCDTLQRLLQENEVDVNWKGSSGLSALHLAAMNGKVVCAEFLLEHGADIECEGDGGHTPLMSAISHGSITTAWLLVESGADTRADARAGEAPFVMVDWASPIPFLELLLIHGADVNTQGYRGTQLILRAEEDDVETARWLLEKGAAVDLVDGRGQTALFRAASRGSVDMVELLLGHGADFSITDEDVDTLLHLACQIGEVALVRRFLDLGIDVGARNCRGDTPSHVAAQKGTGDCLELLLAQHADVDVANQIGRTPLMDAIYSCSSKVIDHLLDAGAKVDLQDRAGWTALHYAASQSNTSTIQILLKHRASCEVRSSLDLSLKYDGAALSVEHILIGKVTDERMFLNAQTLHNWTPGYVWRKLVHIIEEAYECRVWEGGMTALDVACVHNNAACIALLEPLTGSKTESTTVPFKDYLCDLFGVSSIIAVMREMKRRKDEEYRERKREQQEKEKEKGENKHSSSPYLGSDTND
ncbi:MAG: hypothetical protein Q9207_008115 [Kuettlingeria erythrocarpa]